MSNGYTFYVDRTAIMLFASAIGETNKIYYDEASAKETPVGGIIAPPSFPTASSQWDGAYFLRRAPDVYPHLGRVRAALDK